MFTFASVLGITTPMAPGTISCSRGTEIAEKVVSVIPYPCITEKYILFTYNNNDRLRAFDPGQPG